MKKIVISLLIGLIFVLVAVGVVLATQGNKGGKAVTPPFPQPAEKDLQKVIFIRYAPGKEPRAVCDNDNICEPRENWKTCPNDCPKGGEEPTPTLTPTPSTSCYAFLSGARPKWNWVEDYYYSGDLGNVSEWATAKWEEPIAGEIFGSGYSESYPWGVYDYKNSILYGDYADPNVIAVTAIWFRGKNIYEYDIMFDTDYLPVDNSIDLDTIVLHEFGHGAGLDDLYNSVCSDEVMYGYYQGEKRDLRSGDVVGIRTLYP